MDRAPCDYRHPPTCTNAELRVHCCIEVLKLSVEGLQRATGEYVDPLAAIVDPAMVTRTASKCWFRSRFAPYHRVHDY